MPMPALRAGPGGAAAPVPLPSQTRRSRRAGPPLTRLARAGAQEAVPVEDAVRMWTIWGARAIGEGKSRGSIEVGKLADMTVLSDDIYAIPPEQIATVQAEHTIVGGRIVYSRQ